MSDELNVVYFDEPVGPLRAEGSRMRVGIVSDEGIPTTAAAVRESMDKGWEEVARSLRRHPEWRARGHWVLAAVADPHNWESYISDPTRTAMREALANNPDLQVTMVVALLDSADIS